jgi:hypothetical protein
MHDETGRAGIPDAVDKRTQERASDEQAEEQDRLDEETRERFAGDPGDPKDRLSESQHERLMEQAQQRELHP